MIIYTQMCAYAPDKYSINTTAIATLDAEVLDVLQAFKSAYSFENNEERMRYGASHG